MLGGKKILTTAMSQFDYSSLVSESVDVERTMSFEMSSAIGASAQVKAGLVKSAAALASKFGGPQGAAIGKNIFLFILCCPTCSFLLSLTLLALHLNNALCRIRS